MTSARERIGRLDVAIALIASTLAVLDVLRQAADESYSSVTPAAAPFIVGLTVPVLWRRVAPVAAMAAMLAALLAHAAIFDGGLVRCGYALPVMFLLAFAAGARLERGQARLGLGLAMALVVGVCLTDGPSGAPPEALTFLAPVTAAIWATGRVARSRSLMADELEVRTGQLRQARDERARLEVTTERARVSSELDELLRRRLGELAQLADVGAGESDRVRATSALAEIERASRTTLEEMRSVVGVLRSSDTDAPLEPQPTLTHLDALLVRARGAGARLEVHGSPRALPPGVELSAYRVVEHLLEALDDAPGVGVRVNFGDDALELVVSGPARRRGEAAIERARERVRLHDGTLEATTRNGQAEALVSLPIYATA